MSQQRILLASRNKEKVKELAACLQGLDVDILSLDDVESPPDVVEDAETFQENAVKKAVQTAQATGMLTVADDSGLVVEALQGAPGVRSARYAGENPTDRENNQKLLREMAKVPEEFRGATFICAVAVADANGLIGVVEASCEGKIATEEKGSQGFGYDPLFIKSGYNKTFAELGPDIKNRVSHRFRAMEKAAILVERRLSEKESKE